MGAEDQFDLRRARGAVTDQIGRMHAAAAAAATHAASQLDEAREIVTASYSSSVMATLRVLADDGAGPPVTVALGEAEDAVHGQRLADGLREVGLGVQVGTGYPAEAIGPATTHVLLGADSIEPTGAFTNGKPSAAVAEAAAAAGVPVIVVSTGVRVVEGIEETAVEAALKIVPALAVTRFVVEDGPATSAELARRARRRAKHVAALRAAAGDVASNPS